MRHANRRFLAISAVLLIFPGALALAESRVEHEFDLGPGGEFILETDQGQVEVVGTSSSGARMVVVARGGEIEEKFDISIEESSSGVRVKVERKGSLSKWFKWSAGSGLRFDIEVPSRTALDIDTSGGSIKVRSIDDKVRLDTSGGSITAQDVTGDVLADTSGGTIMIENIDGNVDADTSGGSIEIERIRGSVKADTSGGSIRLYDVREDIYADTSGGSIRIRDAGGRVEAGTSGGSISASFVAGNGAGGELSTSGGGITVSVDGSVSLDIDAVASGGSVKSDVPVSVQGRISKTHLRGKMGGGGPPLRLRTSGGRITIEPL
ncbi:MAG: DUF4097 domain-containing protein [bacterium]|nr:DUF4097 domain-containing protein [bacterium]